MAEVWPAILVTGVTFGLTQALVARFEGPWLVDIFASVISIAVLVVFLRFWKPRRILNAKREDITHHPPVLRGSHARMILHAALPWIILTVCVTVWGTPAFAQMLDKISVLRIHVPGLDQVVMRMPPAVPAATAEPAVFNFNWLSATGTGIFLASLIAAFAMGLHPRTIVKVFGETIAATRYMLVTIAALMALGFITRFAGLDATLGLAFARTGFFYPFFGTLIGWLGTASTGSDTSSNVLFGSLQKLTAQQLNISPFIMTAANSGGGVMGKMVAPQSVVVASTATGCYGEESSILRFVFLHSLALACLMGLLVLAVVHFPGLTALILR